MANKEDHHASDVKTDHEVSPFPVANAVETHSVSMVTSGSTEKASIRSLNITSADVELSEITSSSHSSSSKQTKKEKKSNSFIFKCRCWKEYSTRRLKLTTLLLVLCMMSTTMSFCLANNISFTITSLPEDPNCYYPLPGSSPYAAFIIPALQNAIIFSLYPVTGWLADTVIGRGKAVRLSLWCNWLGSVLYVVSFCMQYGLCGLPVNIAKYGISSLALIFIMFGNANAFTNIPPYGQDQLVNESSGMIRAFIHWLIWGMYIGFSFSYVSFIPTIVYRPVVILTTGMIVFLFNSLVLILFGTFNYKFKPSGVLRKNPYRTIYQVLKYAVQHKSPTNRSAMTYWEHTAPSRIDLGKEKYGGPFAEGEVEDVKVFWRIFGVIVSTFGLHFPLIPVLLGIFGFMNSFQGADVLDGYGSYIFWTILDQSVIFIVPVVHFIIIPLFAKIDFFLIKSLRNIGALYVLMLVAILSLIVITIVAYYITPYSVPCVNVSEVLQLSFYWFAIPLFFSGLVGSFRLILCLEFIVSQSPANMSGVLNGAFWFIQAVCISLGSYVQVPFQYTNADGPGKLSCNFWILVIHFCVFIVSFAVYLVSASKYKRRQREEVYDYHNVIEEIFIKTFDREQEAINEGEKSSSNEFHIVSVDNN